MKPDQAAKVLRAHQDWRKGGDGPLIDIALLTQALDAAVAALEAQESLKDPAAVLVNMMRGNIANPHADTAARCDALAAENDRLRERLEGMASAVPVAHRYRIGGPTVEWRYAPGDATLTRNAIVESEPLYAGPQPAYCCAKCGLAEMHPRERALHQDAKRGNFRQEDDGA